jgi:hypothetical protein
MEIYSDFTGSMLGGSRVVGDKVFITLKKEKVTKGYFKNHNYNLHFHFGIRNSEDTDRIMEFFIETDEGSELPRKFDSLWISDGDNREIIIKKIDGRMDGKGKFTFKLEIKGRGDLLIANYHPFPYEDLLEEFSRIVSDSKPKIRKIGRSVEGRDIIAYEFGDIENKPCLMFISGYHPPEGDPISIQTIMENFNDEKAKNDLIKDFSFSFIPFVNPDGFIHNTQGSNLNDINFHWKFFGNTEEECPECHCIWEYCKKVRPAFFMDFHVFTFQNNPPRAYRIPPLYVNGSSVKRVQKEINKDLSALCDQKFGFSNAFFTPRKILAPNILATRLRDDFNTVTSPKFHVLIKEGEEECRRKSQAVFDIVITAFRKYWKGRGSAEEKPNRSSLVKKAFNYYNLKLRR